VSSLIFEIFQFLNQELRKLIKSTWAKVESGDQKIKLRWDNHSDNAKLENCAKHRAAGLRRGQRGSKTSRLQVSSLEWSRVSDDRGCTCEKIDIRKFERYAIGDSRIISWKIRGGGRRMQRSCQSLEDEMLYAAVTGEQGKDFEREVESPRLASV